MEKDFPNLENPELIWDDVAVFLAVARSGSLSGAATALSLGLATVSRRLDRFEASIGRQLFVRHHSGYRLNEDGAALIERAEDVEASARALSSGVRDIPEVAGTVRLATAENLANELVLPALPRLQSAYPNLLLHISTDIATANLRRRDADLALRMVKPDRGQLNVQKVGTMGYGLYAAAAYLDRACADLGNQDVIAWSDDYAHLPAAKWIKRALRGRAPAVITTSLSSQVAACAAGLGVAVLPHFVAKPRELVCLEADLGIDQPIWLVTQTDLVSSRRIRVVADFLREVVLEGRTILTGR